MLRTYFGRSGQASLKANLKSMQPKRCDHSPMRLLAKTAPSIGVILCLDLPMKLQCIWTFTSSTAQGGGGSFKNRKPVGEVGCESGMAERSHWWTERCLISLSLFLSLSLFFSLFLSLSLIIHLPTYLPTDLSIYSIYLSIYLSTLDQSLASISVLAFTRFYKCIPFWGCQTNARPETHPRGDTCQILVPLMLCPSKWRHIFKYGTHTHNHIHIITCIWYYYYCYYYNIYIFIFTYIHTCMHPSIHPYIHTSIHPFIHTDRQTYIQTDRHTYRHTDRHADIQAYIQTSRHTDIHTDSRHTYTQTCIQTYRHTYRQTAMHAYMHTCIDTCIHR